MLGRGWNYIISPPRLQLKLCTCITMQRNGKQGTAFLGKPNVLSLRHHIQLQQISSKPAESSWCKIWKTFQIYLPIAWIAAATNSLSWLEIYVWNSRRITEMLVSVAKLVRISNFRSFIWVGSLVLTKKLFRKGSNIPWKMYSLGTNAHKAHTFSTIWSKSGRN